MCSQKFRKKSKPLVPRDKNDQTCTTALYIHSYSLWFSYDFKVCSKSVSEIRYICLMIVGAVIIHKMFDTGAKHLPARWPAEIFPRFMWVKKFNLQITFLYIHFSHYVYSPKCIVDITDIQKTIDHFDIISLVNDLLKSNWRYSLFSLVSLWGILLQDIGTKWWLLLVPGTVFDFFSVWLVFFFLFIFLFLFL